MSRFGFDSYKFTDVGRRETVNSLQAATSSFVNVTSILLVIKASDAVVNLKN